MMIGCRTHKSDAGGTGDPTKTQEMDCSHSPQTSRLHYTTSLNLESRGEKEKRATEKHLAQRSGTRHQRNWIIYTWRQFERLAQDRMLGVVMLAAYAPDGATKAFNCLLLLNI